MSPPSQPLRRPFVAGNWKMHLDLAGAVALAKGVAEGARGERAEVAVVPPACFLAPVLDAVKGSGLPVGAQNLHSEARGAFTGEVSAPMLRSLGVRYVLCGHSERRQLFGETSEWIGRKVAAAHGAGLVPILCVGETLEERDAGTTETVVAGQLDLGLSGLSANQVAATVLAYEPVWAIGTGRNATPEEAQAVHAFLRDRLARRHGAEVAAAVRIQYGGSVKPSNAKELLSQPDIDGALVGGASLEVESFLGIVRSA